MSERGWSDDELKDFFETNALILFASRVRATLERLQAERDEARRVARVLATYRSWYEVDHGSVWRDEWFRASEQALAYPASSSEVEHG